jgi:hypothetical protein
VTIKQVLDAEASNTDSAISIQDIDVTNVRILRPLSHPDSPHPHLPSIITHFYLLKTSYRLPRTQVSFCGVVRDIVRNATNVLLQVEDGTGGIEVRKWIDSSDGESEGFEAETGIQFRESDRSSSIPIILMCFVFFFNQFVEFEIGCE